MTAATFTGGAAFEAKLREIAERVGAPNVLRVGFLEGATYPGGATYEQETSVAMVAALLNFGTSRMPPRPFFTQMVEEKKGNWGKSLGNIAAANDYDMKKTMNLMGQGIKGQLQTAIVDFDSVPLAPSTVARKGFAKQLIDKGVMLRAADYDVAE